MKAVLCGCKQRRTFDLFGGGYLTWYLLIASTRNAGHVIRLELQHDTMLASSNAIQEHRQ